MPTLFLMCGLPGAGKTTVAKQLERDRPALRLTPDEWMAALGIDLFDEAARARVEALQWGVAAQALQLGFDAILDFGVWARVERDDFRARAAALGADCEVVFLYVPVSVLWKRLQSRNANLGEGEVPLQKSHLDEYVRLFQPPDPDENVVRISSEDRG